MPLIMRAVYQALWSSFLFKLDNMPCLIHWISIEKAPLFEGGASVCGLFSFFELGRL